MVTVETLAHRFIAVLESDERLAPVRLGIAYGCLFVLVYRGVRRGWAH